MHAFMTSCLDYALRVDVSLATVSRYQLLQNAAARLLSGTRKQEHVPPVLPSHSLGFLHISGLIFNMSLLVLKCLNGLAPTHLC